MRTIRRLTEADDLDEFGRMVLASYLAVPGMPREPGYEAELVDVAGRVREGVVYGAYIDDVPAGCVTFVAGASSPHAEGLLPGESSLRMLAVGLDVRGAGVGQALVERCLDDAVGLASTAVFIYSGTWMRSAHRLYVRLGFEFVPERDWVFEDPPVHLLGLRLQL